MGEKRKKKIIIKRQKYSVAYWKPKEKNNRRTNKEEEGKQARKIKFGGTDLNFIKKEIFLAESQKH